MLELYLNHTAFLSTKIFGVLNSFWILNSFLYEEVMINILVTCGYLN